MCFGRRDIRKALAALSRELNASEGKRLELEGALRSAGGGSGIQEVGASFSYIASCPLLCCFFFLILFYFIGIIDW